MGRERWREDRGLGFRKLSKEQNIEREYVLVCVSIGVCVCVGRGGGGERDRDGE